MKLCLLVDHNGRFINSDGLLFTKDEVEELKQMIEVYEKVKNIEEINEKILEARKKENWYMNISGKQEKPGYVYFVKCENGGVKIGKTSNIESRLKALQTASPYKLELLEYVKCEKYADFELYSHDYFSGRRLEGEWFDITHEEVKSFLKKEGFDVETRTKL